MINAYFTLSNFTGAVYDISAYVDYHPGGAEELMRGAGIDSTDLFNEVHKWVNFQNMLKEYLIGYLVDAPKKLPQVPGKTSLTVPQLQPPVSHPVIPVGTKFTFDSYQTERCFTLIVYGKTTLTNQVKSCFFYGMINKKALKVFVHCIDKKFLLDLSLYSDLQKFDIRSSNLKFEIVIHKQLEAIWPSEGAHSSQSKTISENSNNLVVFEVICTENIGVTHDTRLLTFKYLNDFHALPPMGSHVFVFNPDGKSLVDKKPYTVYNVVDHSTFQLLVKKYENGIMSSYVCSLQANQTAQMQGFDHFIDLNVLHKNKNIIILAAGTGITPFYRIIKELSTNKHFTDHSCSLIFFNKTQSDILEKEKFEEFQRHMKKLEIIHILSQENWDGLTGHIELSHLTKFSPKSLYLTCGPKMFMKKSVEVLSSKGVPGCNIIEFNG